MDVMTLRALADRALRAEPPDGFAMRVIAVDGCGGAGKTTFAERLARALGGVPVAHTDDFAGWEHPLDWYPRVVTELFEPLAAGRSAQIERNGWGPWAFEVVTVEPAPTLILEGVSSSRRYFARYLAFRIWVEASRETRLQRGLERDGEHMRSQWEQWMAGEDRYVDSERPAQHADVVISGDPVIAHDPETEFVRIR